MDHGPDAPCPELGRRLTSMTKEEAEAIESTDYTCPDCGSVGCCEHKGVCDHWGCKHNEDPCEVCGCPESGKRHPSHWDHHTFTFVVTIVTDENATRDDARRLLHNALGTARGLPEMPTHGATLSSWRVEVRDDEECKTGIQQVGFMHPTE